MNLTQTAAYSEKTPYEIWQKDEALPIYRGHAIPDLAKVETAPWKRKGANGAFINFVGSGRTCDAYVLEIPPKKETSRTKIFLKN